MKSFKTRVAELIDGAFASLVEASDAERHGDRLARRHGLDPADTRETFELIYFDGDEEASLKADVYGCYHDAAGEEYCGETIIDDVLKMLTRELGPLRPLEAQ